MIACVPALPSDRAPRVLCLGAHSDDIEIGCAGLLRNLLEARPDAALTWCVFAATPEREAETRAAAIELVAGSGAGHIDVGCERFRDGFFPAGLDVIKPHFEWLKAVEPDLILTHHLHDAHQDHRVVAELTRNTWRSHLVLEYEIPKYDGDLGNPSVFMPLSRDDARAKAALLMRHFVSQRSRAWFEEETFLGLMRLRGMQCAAPGGYAEAFHAPKQALRFEAPGRRAPAGDQTTSSAGIGNTSLPPHSRT